METLKIILDVGIMIGDVVIICLILRSWKKR